MRKSQRTQRVHFTYRLEVRFSEGSLEDGLWVGAGTPTNKTERARGLQRIRDALTLIRTVDPHRYGRLRTNLDRIWMRAVETGGLGSYLSGLRACLLDHRFVLSPETTLEALAAAIVHEATHARLDGCGIGYGSAGERARVEEVCRRQEIAFAARLPAGDPVRENAERGLDFPESFWTDDAFRERHLQGVADALRGMGASGWFIALVLAPARLYLRLAHVGRGLTRASSGRARPPDA